MNYFGFSRFDISFSRRICNSVFRRVFSSVLLLGSVSVVLALVLFFSLLSGLCDRLIAIEPQDGGTFLIGCGAG